MIVPTMSYPEIYRVLENAAPKIRYKTEQLRPKAVKCFTREVWNYPAWKTFEYTIPATNDTYVIFFYATDAPSSFGTGWNWHRHGKAGCRERLRTSFRI